VLLLRQWGITRKSKEMEAQQVNLCTSMSIWANVAGYIGYQNSLQNHMESFEYY
jgi:hypothetical protein